MKEFPEEVVLVEVEDSNGSRYIFPKDDLVEKTHQLVGAGDLGGGWLVSNGKYRFFNQQFPHEEDGYCIVREVRYRQCPPATE